MDRRHFLQGSGAVALSCSSISTAFSQSKEPIKVGILHSLSGTMAISETALKECNGSAASSSRGRSRIELALIR
jgi:urea transport system substrate-binding protein